MTETLIEYDPTARPDFALLDGMYVERGTKADWDLLHHLHYKNEGGLFAPHFYRLALDGETIGVTALTPPRPLLKERHAVFPRLKPGHDTTHTNTLRYQWINGNIRVIGRIVLDTMFRGVGASYRFQNLVARMSGYPIVEIQSAMSKYNQFAQKAGFQFVKPMRSNKFDVGVKFFRETFESHPADTDAILMEIASMPAAAQKATVAAMRKFYYANSAKEKTGSARLNNAGVDRVAAMEVPHLLAELQQLVLGSPLYGVYLNPDKGRALPDRLPLRAFDAQAVNEPLKEL